MGSRRGTDRLLVVPGILVYSPRSQRASGARLDAPLTRRHPVCPL